jgi:hypothetical protein
MQLARAHIVYVILAIQLSATPTNCEIGIGPVKPRPFLVFDRPDDANSIDRLGIAAYTPLQLHKR